MSRPQPTTADLYARVHDLACVLAGVAAELEDPQASDGLPIGDTLSELVAAGERLEPLAGTAVGLARRQGASWAWIGAHLSDHDHPSARPLLGQATR